MTLSKKKTEETVEEKILYREPMRVTTVEFRPKSGETYDACPRCDRNIEREYMEYFTLCGQKLSWVGYYKAKLRIRNDQQFGMKNKRHEQ